MAKSRTTEAGYTNPEVRFERSDIEIGGVVNFSLVLALVLVGSGVLALFVGSRISSGAKTGDKSALPAAFGEKAPEAHLPPEPRLEAIDDLRNIKNRNLELFPARAGDSLHKQERSLAEGKPADGSEPIGDAIAQLAGKLPARKKEPPASFGLALPSTSSSGRFTPGREVEP